MTATSSTTTENNTENILKQKLAGNFAQPSNILEFLSHTGTQDISAGAFSLLRLLEHIDPETVITPKNIANALNDFAERCGGKYVEPRRVKSKKHIKPNKDRVKGNKFRRQLLELESVGLAEIYYYKDEQNKALPSGYRINIDNEILSRLASGELRPAKKIKDDNGKTIRKKITYHFDLSEGVFSPSGKLYIKPPKLEVKLADCPEGVFSPSGKNGLNTSKSQDKISKTPEGDFSPSGKTQNSSRPKSRQTVETVDSTEADTPEESARDASRIYNSSNISNKNNNPPNPPSEKIKPSKVDLVVVGALKKLILDSKLRAQFNTATYSRLKKNGLSDGQIKTLVNDMNAMNNIKSAGWLIAQAKEAGVDGIADYNEKQKENLKRQSDLEAQRIKSDRDAEKSQEETLTRRGTSPLAKKIMDRMKNYTDRR